MGTVALAAREFGIPVDHLWASEKCKKTRHLLEAVLGDEVKIYHDMTKRKLHRTKTPDCYVAGFPCQPFSAAGRNRGMRDTRSHVALHVLETIIKLRPRAFLLENVRNLMGKHKMFSELIVDLLSNSYKINHKVVNSLDFGLPQNRPRIYITGVRKDSDFHAFQWPRAAPAAADPNDFLDPPPGP